MIRLWVDSSSANSAGQTVGMKAADISGDISRQVASRASRALDSLRNAELEVLNGQRGNKDTTRQKSPYDSFYGASAPGEPPARRTGNLRLHWNGNIEGGQSSGGASLTLLLESQERYSAYLENGTRKMAARPFVDRIKEKAMPEIESIFSEPYGR